MTSESDSPIAAISAAMLAVFAATRRKTSANTSQRGASSITLAARPLPVTGPSSRSTMFLGFLAFARLASVMKVFDAGDQLNRLSPCAGHSRFLVGNQD